MTANNTINKPKLWLAIWPCLLAVVVFLTETTAAGDIKIAAFNIKKFGTKKAKDPGVMKILVEIIIAYDLILIEEVLDESAIDNLINDLEGKGVQYGKIISGKLGRTNYKEQYAFLYRKDSGIKPDGSFQYTRNFERPPFVVRFSIPNLPMTHIAFIPVHIKPAKVLLELNSLLAVYEKTKETWDIQDIIMLGDMNADCAFLPEAKRPKVKLHDPAFYWPIDYGEDTTVAESVCAYDRFIIAGQKMIKLAKKGEASVFRFDDEYGLTKEEANAVSDHYPIVLSLPNTKKNMELRVGLESPYPVTHWQRKVRCLLRFLCW